MAIFEYRCKEHGLFDEISRIAKKTLACPVCGRQASRVWSVPGKPKVSFRAGFCEPAGMYFDTQKQRDNWAREVGAVKR